METNTLPKMDMLATETGCCPRFNPQGWDGRHLHFEDKLFVRATTRAILHVPIDMGSVFTRVQQHIEDAGAQDPEGYLVLSRDLSATEGEHYFAVTTPVPDEEMVTLSGDYITRVFEGPYRHAKDWVHDMDVAARAAGRRAKTVYMFYTTCPKCARHYHENYIVGVAELEPQHPEPRSANP
ncbi:hydrolase [uncultured Tateyamaria sp.]|uniref:hydrolase n=1 Tax=uncultured Tateyamaria sp. TaxID=455651 RepID=UPI0026020F01|nr:hydrolase [uncultured Tateyamaria sp.]